MWISSVELRNIKSYRNETIRFKPGVNGISGENGAGKTTILESIGFALFDELPYSKKEFLRKGEKTGEVRVHVVASDDLEYVITRSVKGEYSVESSIGRIAVGKVDVQDWIVENLFGGVLGPGDLSPIFENAVGVPQGTFTSSFLSTPAVRKKVFDNILRVEEYRRAFENLGDVSKIIKTEIESLKNEYHELKGGTAKYGELKEDYEGERIRVSEIKEDITELEKQLKQLQLKRDDLGKRKELIDSTEKEVEKIERDVEELKKHLTIAKKQLEDSLIAKKVLEDTIDAKEKYLDAQKRLKELGEERKKRDRIEKQMREQETKLKQMETELERKNALLNELENNKKSLKEIEPLVKKQQQLEKQIKDAEDRIREIILIESDINDLKKSIEEFKTLSENLREIERKQKEIEPDVKKQEELESKKHTITGKRSAIASEIKKIRMKKGETGDTNLCPILDGVKCAAVSSFSDYFENRLNERDNELRSTKDELKRIEKELKDLNNPKKRMEVYKSRISEITGQLKKRSDVQDGLKQRQSDLKKSHESFRERYSQYLPSIQDAPELREKMEKVIGIMETELKELNDPMQQASKMDALIDARTKELERIKVDDNVIKLEKSKLFEIRLGLSEFSDLDSREKDARKIMQDCEPYYRRYLQNEKNADNADAHQRKCDELSSEISKKISEKEHLVKDLTGYRSMFDCKVFERVNREYEQRNIELGSKRTEYTLISKNLERLKNDLKDMESLIRKKEELKRECESKRGFWSYVEFIRTTLKDSAQLVAGKLIKNIGEEANRIYCEIINDYTQELRWTHDYAIVITEHGEEKEFNQLSGGEQMCSSLAARFALLKVLSGCDVVFLDEPTQNMDEIRREKLSEQILNISGFKQIFVISHDDTFNEKYENVITVQKINGESRVTSDGAVS
ncbi:MAG: SMC family ATPase [Methanosarcinales archaeon]|nr:SMC family ATPase [Methanosarcinales archaeon]